jgi:preprotein translocase subunit SecA
MSKLGLEEGEHIESGMVTRAVENAQKKVEAMHFESRKHLLEYDDVANKQRNAIFEFRDQLLDSNFEIEEKLKQNMNEYCTVLLDEANIIDGMTNDDFNLDMLIGKLQEELGLVITAEQLENKTFEEIQLLVMTTMKEFYNNKMSVVPDDQQSEIERILYLQILDNSWRDHLYSMDTLKTGIGLRSYNQKDPLVEYKKESYNMFIELITSIKSEIIKILFTIQLQDEEVEKKELEKMKEQMESSVKNIHLNNEEPIAVVEKKIARNEPCPCGSGKKYKQCCGKSGPKRGVLAQ